MTYGLPYGAAAGPMSRTSGSSSGRTARRSGGSTSSPLSSPGSSLSSTSPNMQTLGTGTGSSTHLFMPYLMTDNNIPATTASNNNCSPGDYHGVATTNNTSTGSSTVWPEESLHTEIARRSANAGYKSSAPNFPGKLDEAANKPLANAKSTAPSPSPRHRVTDCAAVAAATSLDASQILQQPLNGNSAAASRSAATEYGDLMREAAASRLEEYQKDRMTDNYIQYMLALNPTYRQYLCNDEMTRWFRKECRDRISGFMDSYQAASYRHALLPLYSAHAFSGAVPCYPFAYTPPSLYNGMASPESQASGTTSNVSHPPKQNLPVLKKTKPTAATAAAVAVAKADVLGKSLTNGKESQESQAQDKKCHEVAARRSAKARRKTSSRSSAANPTQSHSDIPLNLSKVSTPASIPANDLSLTTQNDEKCPSVGPESRAVNVTVNDVEVTITECSTPAATDTGCSSSEAKTPPTSSGEHTCCEVKVSPALGSERSFTEAKLSPSSSSNHSSREAKMSRASSSEAKMSPLPSSKNSCSEPKISPASSSGVSSVNCREQNQVLTLVETLLTAVPFVEDQYTQQDDNQHLNLLADTVMRMELQAKVCDVGDRLTVDDCDSKTESGFDEMPYMSNDDENISCQDSSLLPNFDRFMWEAGTRKNTEKNHPSVEEMSAELRKSVDLSQANQKKWRRERKLSARNSSAAKSAMYHESDTEPEILALREKLLALQRECKGASDELATLNKEKRAHEKLLRRKRGRPNKHSGSQSPTNRHPKPGRVDTSRQSVTHQLKHTKEESHSNEVLPLPKCMKRKAPESNNNNPPDHAKDPSPTKAHRHSPSKLQLRKASSPVAKKRKNILAKITSFAKHLKTAKKNKPNIGEMSRARRVSSPDRKKKLTGGSVEEGRKSRHDSGAVSMPNSPNFEGLRSPRRRRFSSPTGDNDSSASHNPLQKINEENRPEPEVAPRSSVLREEEIRDGLRVMVLREGLFHLATIKDVMPPDVYAIEMDSDPRKHQEYFSREQVLEEAIVEVRPVSRRFLPPGTRVCCYWSRMLQRSLFPGTVLTDDSDVEYNPHELPVEFDDGDSSIFALENIRMLPHNFPIVKYKDPLETLGKKRRKSGPALVVDDDYPLYELGCRPGMQLVADKSLSRGRKESSPVKRIYHMPPSPVSPPGRPSITHIVHEVQKKGSATSARNGGSNKKTLTQSAAAGTQEVCEKINDSDRVRSVTHLPAASHISKEKKQQSSHMQPAALFRTPWQWYGEPIKKTTLKGKAKKVFYAGIRRNGQTIQLNDSAVFVSMERALPFIGRVDSMWQSWKGQMKVKVRWFYHPEETKGCADRYTNFKGALYESPHTDENDIQTIAFRCNILPYQDFCEKGKEQIMKKTKLLQQCVGDVCKAYYVAGEYDPYINSLKHCPQ